MSKAALCVGINQFKNLPQSSRLQGCVNDAGDLAGLLHSRYGFTASDVTVLLDAQATKQRVMAELGSLMARFPQPCSHNPVESGLYQAWFPGLNYGDRGPYWPWLAPAALRSGSARRAQPARG